MGDASQTAAAAALLTEHLQYTPLVRFYLLRSLVFS